MKNLTLTAALIAVTTTFAVPSFAMDNPVAESRAKTASVLASQKASSKNHAATVVRATTFSAKKTGQLDRFQLDAQRPFGSPKGIAT